MRISENFKKNLRANIVTPSMLGAVLYSYNKRAKNMRDQEREYRCFNRYDKYDNAEKYREKKEFYYSRKEKLLGMLSPTEIHAVMREKRKRIYEYQPEYSAAILSGDVVHENCYWDREKGGEIWFCDVSVPFEEHYLYYQVGDYSFHSPIDSPDKYKLPLRNIGNLETYGESTDNLLSVQSCEKIYKGLQEGTLTYVHEEN